MDESPSAGTQRIVPYLYYADAPAALEFLTSVCGFEEYLRVPGGDGLIAHAEVGYRDNRVMLASKPPPREAAGAEPAHFGLVSCSVDDVDAHYRHAKAAGANILQELEDKFYGDRSYSLKDPEGHVWYFTTHVKDVDPAEWTTPTN